MSSELKNEKIARPGSIFFVTKEVSATKNAFLFEEVLSGLKKWQTQIFTILLLSV